MAATKSVFELEGLGADRPPLPVSGTDLARGMLLLRASNMKIVRLQLAMARQDRRLAMEALDGLTDLDGALQSFIDDMPDPGSPGEIRDLSLWIEGQKRAIASEKLILGSGIMGPSLLSAASTHQSPPAPPKEVNAPPPHDAARGNAWAPPPIIDLYDHVPDDDDRSQTRRRIGIAVAMLVLTLGAATILRLLGLIPVPPIEGLSF